MCFFALSLLQKVWYACLRAHRKVIPRRIFAAEKDGIIFRYVLGHICCTRASGKQERHVHEIQAAVKTDSRKGFQFVMYYPMLYHCRRIEDTVVYMEVYGSNRVIYRVTAGWVVRPDGTAKSVYGICLEDLRSGEQQALEDFSDTLDQTILFANHLVEQEIRPEELYDAALKQLSHQVLSSRRIFSR